MKPMTEQHLALFRHMVEIIDTHFDLAEDELGKFAPGECLRQAARRAPPLVRAAVAAKGLPTCKPPPARSCPSASASSKVGV